LFIARFNPGSRGAIPFTRCCLSRSRHLPPQSFSPCSGWSGSSPIATKVASKANPFQVGVGIMIAHNPLHGSGQAGFSHPALALGEDVAAPRKRAMPEPSHLEPKQIQRRLVHGHSVVADVSTHHRLQPLAYFGDGFVHASLNLGFRLVQLRLQPFANRLPQHREPSIAPLLATLRRRSCEQLRTTRGRCGSPIHTRRTFAFTTPRRFNRRTGANQ
jgi:hypothetical protein